MQCYLLDCFCNKCNKSKTFFCVGNFVWGHMHEWTWLNGYKSHLSESQRNEKNYKVFFFIKTNIQIRSRFIFILLCSMQNSCSGCIPIHLKILNMKDLYILLGMYPIVIVWIEIVVTEIFEISWKD